MAEQPEELQLAAWRAFLTAHARAMAVLEDELQAECDLALAWYDVLVQLSDAAENRLRMHELARAVLLSRAGLTRLVDRMTAAGLVERVPCQEDRRGTWVAMTAEGRRVLDNASPVHLRGVERHFTRHLADREAEELREVCARVVAALEPRL
ncbi:MAG: MarR family transcriptional regulator [Dehalococcoidia bacterium]|nr:MarR family transcriptional regulator [Dehalococcoidia bacterium]